MESFFFGKNYNDENIRIQIIHNIIDIKKILSVYMNDIIYTINLAMNNCKRTNTIDNFENEQKKQMYYSYFQDYIGIDNYKLYNFKKSNPYLTLFGDMFEFKETDQEILVTLSKIRNFCTHNFDQNVWLIKGNTTNPNASNVKNKSINIINEYYDKYINVKLKTEIKNQKKNLFLLEQIHKISSLQKTNKNDFILINYFKDFKNIGISIKKIREVLFDSNGINKEITYLSALNKFIDYCIINEICIIKNYKDMELKPEYFTFVEKLREGYDSIEIYKELSKIVNKKVNVVAINNVLEKNSIVKVDPNYGFNEIKDTISIIKKELDNTQFFSKLVYFVTMFLEAKETNKLVTTLINKFARIGAFISYIRNKSNMDKLEFKVDYKFFEFSEKISNDLMLIHNIGKHKEEQKPKNELMKAAYHLFQGKNWEKFEEDFFNLNKGKLEIKKDVKSFYNYLNNSIVKSRKFLYLIKYLDVDKLKHVVKNKCIVKYILDKTINSNEKSQIYKYIEAIPKYDLSKFENPLDTLVEYMTTFSIDKLFKVQGDLNNKNNTEIRDKYKRFINLYISIFYIFIKNMIDVNIRYFIAWGMLETDYYFITNKIFNENNSFSKYFELLKENNLTSESKRLLGEIKSNTNNIGRLIMFNRNYTTHVSFLDKFDVSKFYSKEPSYFKMYHYQFHRLLLQVMFKKEYINEDFYKKNFENYNEKTRLYLNKRIYLPLIYNKSRYNSLISNSIFNNYYNKDNKNGK